MEKKEGTDKKVGYNILENMGLSESAPLVKGNSTYMKHKV